MNIFNLKQRNILSFDKFMNSNVSSVDYNKLINVKSNKEKDMNTSMLEKYRRIITRDPHFNHSVYDSTYRAIASDLVHKQAGKKVPTVDSATGIPTVKVNESKNEGTIKSTVTHDDVVTKHIKRNKENLKFTNEAISYDAYVSLMSKKATK